MVEMKAEVVEHYGQGDLKERLSRALYAAGLSSQVLSPMVLAPLDQFHVRGNRCNEGTRGSGAGRPRRDGSGRWIGPRGSFALSGGDLWLPRDAINAVKLVRCCLYTPALDISKLTPAVDTQK